MHSRFIPVFRVQLGFLLKECILRFSLTFLDRPGEPSRLPAWHSDAPGSILGAFGDGSAIMHYPETGDRPARRRPLTHGNQYQSGKTPVGVLPTGDKPESIPPKAKDLSHLRPGIGFQTFGKNFPKVGVERTLSKTCRRRHLQSA